MSTLKYIYILADDDYFAVEAWHALKSDGLIPYCPNVVKLLELHCPIDDPWDFNRAWLDKCDAIFRVGDDGDEEVLRYAYSKQIPIFTEIDELSTRIKLRVHAP